MVFGANWRSFANLKVINHNSVAKYGGVLDTVEIGRALNVAYVLKGSLRKDADRIHVNGRADWKRGKMLACGRRNTIET